MSLRIIAAFGAGLYSGIYVSQNYDIPPVDSLDKFLEHLERKVQELKPKSDMDLSIPIQINEEHDIVLKESKTFEDENK